MVSTKKNDRPHYVYELRRTSSGPGPTRYIGVRTAERGDPEKDDYWGSSKKINKERAAGATFSKVILATFETRSDAEFCEAELHWQHMVGKNPHFYNVTAQLIEGKMDLLFPRERYISPDGEHLWYIKGSEPVGWRHDPAKWAQFKIPTDDDEELSAGNGIAYTYQGLELPAWKFNKYVSDELAFATNKPRHCHEPYVQLDFRNDILACYYFPVGRQPVGWVHGLSPNFLIDRKIPNGWQVYFHIFPKSCNSAYFANGSAPNGWVDVESYEELSKAQSANGPVADAINSEFRHIFRIAECEADAITRLRGFRAKVKLSELVDYSWASRLSDLDLGETEKKTILEIIGENSVALQLHSVFDNLPNDADEEFRQMLISNDVRGVFLRNIYTRSGLEWTKIVAALDLCSEDKALVYEHIKDMIGWQSSVTDPPMPEFYDDALKQSAPALDPLVDHQSAILIEATRLHKEAMSHLEKPNADPLPQLREAKRLLAEAEMLTSDAASYVDAMQMDTALAELHRQQGQVDAMIVQVEARKCSTNNSVWGWIVLAVLLVLACIVVV